VTFKIQEKNAGDKHAVRFTALLAAIQESLHAGVRCLSGDGCASGGQGVR
jgi:hypothetical protein